MWLNPQAPAGLVTFTEEIINEKLRFLCSEYSRKYSRNYRHNKAYKILKFEKGIPYWWQ